MSAPASRTYVIGLPVVVTVYDDGTVAYEVDTSEAGVAVLDDDEAPFTYAERQADAARVDADHDRGPLQIASMPPGLGVGDLVTEGELRAFGNLPGVMVIGLDDDEVEA